MTHIDAHYVKQYLTHNKIVFATNQFDNVMAGFQNYGPHGVKIKDNIIKLWKEIFVDDPSDDIFQIECPVLTPECVLTRSGHVAKFSDLGIVFFCKKSSKIINIKRADHWVEEQLETNKLIDAKVNIDDVASVTEWMNVNNLYDKEKETIHVGPISLMYKIESQCSSNTMYLRPEVAQTIFVEFKQFYEYNNEKLPFGIAQVGKSFRNEISDKPYTRLREFTQAEIEYFFNPFDTHKYHVPESIKNNTCLILSNTMQTEKIIKLTESELDKYISNTIIKKFFVKFFMFAKQLGLDMDLIRFRQHKPNEMSHYAEDCWDLESNIFGKWLEIAGLAHRSDYDLTVHDRDGIFKVKKSSVPDTLYKITLDHKKVLSKYGDDAKQILKQFKPITTPDLLSVQWESDSELYVVSKIKEYQMITPNVIEPSIGIDRIFYTLICHNLSIRTDGKRPLLSLNSNCKIYDCMLAQLSNNEELLYIFNHFMKIIKDDYPALKVFTDMSSTSIGKRYTRADEIGIQYSLTIDFDTNKDNTVTVRNSTDMKQTRMGFRDALQYIFNSTM